MESIKKVLQHPFFTVMIKPRNAMRQVLDTDPVRLVVPLILLATFSQTLVEKRYDELVQVLRFAPRFGALLLLLVVALACIAIVLLFYGFSFLMTWTGRFLGGKADARQVRSALGWGSVPYVWALLYRLPARIFYGEDIILPIFGRESSRGALALDWGSSATDMVAIVIGYALLEVVFAVWYVIVINKCLGEAQGFSAWRAFGSFLLAVITPALVLMALFLITKALLA